MDEPEQLKVKRLFWAGPLTVIASVVTVLFIRIIAVAILKPDPKFEPLTVWPPTFDTVVAATCAVLVCLKCPLQSGAGTGLSSARGESFDSFVYT